MIYKIITIICGILSLSSLWLFLLLIRRISNRNMLAFFLRFPLFILYLFLMMIGATGLDEFASVWRIIIIVCYLLGCVLVVSYYAKSCTRSNSDDNI